MSVEAAKTKISLSDTENEIVVDDVKQDTSSNEKLLTWKDLASLKGVKKRQIKTSVLF